jgi:hypothetical protein
VAVGVYLIGLGISAAFRSQGDFAIYYLAGQRVAHHSPLYPDSDSDRFLYAPVFAVAFVPLGRMSAGSAQCVWFLVNAAALVAFIVGSGRMLFGKRQLPASLILIPLVFVARFINNNVEHGQINLCSLALIVWAVVAGEARRPAVSGAMLAAATLIKPFAMLAGLYLMLTKRKAPLIWAGLWIAILLILPVLFFGPARAIDETSNYLHAAASMGARYHTMLTNQSATSASIRLFERVVGEGEAFRIGIAFEIALVLSVGGWIINAGDPALVNGRLALCGLFCIMPSLAPVSWKSYYASLLPPYMALVSALWTDRPPEAGSTAAARALVGLSVLMNILGGQKLKRWALFYSFHFLSSLVVLAALIATARIHPGYSRSRRVGAPPAPGR